jgi:hypothetical protein
VAVCDTRSAESSSARSRSVIAGVAASTPGRASAPPAASGRRTSSSSTLASWESSPGIRRFFAGCCGSPIFKRDDAHPALLGFRLGTLDADPGRKAELHFRIGSKVPWLDVHDSLRQEAGGPAFGERD